MFITRWDKIYHPISYRGRCKAAGNCHPAAII